MPEIWKTYSIQYFTLIAANSSKGYSTTLARSCISTLSVYLIRTMPCLGLIVRKIATKEWTILCTPVKAIYPVEPLKPELTVKMSLVNWIQQSYIDGLSDILNISSPLHPQHGRHQVQFLARSKSLSQLISQVFEKAKSQAVSWSSLSSQRCAVQNSWPPWRRKRRCGCILHHFYLYFDC